MYSSVKIPPIVSERNFDELLFQIEKASSFDDIFICDDSPIYVKSNGRLYVAGERNVGESEVRFITNHIYGGDNGRSEIVRGNEHDDSYEIVQGDLLKRYRYRVNIVSNRGQGNAPLVRITLRSIRTDSLTFEELNIEPEIVDAFCPKQGLVLVVGGTGSGKSTLLSAGIRSILEDVNSHSVICEYSAPVETTYHTVKKRSSIIYQHEIGKDVKSFSQGVKNSLRSNPDVILIGEMRDTETIEAGLTASLTGHLVYSTLHANSPAEAISRMVMAFNEKERKSRAADLIAALRLVVSQRLLLDVSGNRVAARGYIVMDEAIRTELLSSDLENLFPTFNRIIEEKGKTMTHSVTELYEKNVISEADYLTIKAGEI
ncbi:MAG: ATPase, T2SS/T4P/T4SS family [Pseudomonadota bacterium]|nr:ATPase, T2SS/T4P/T4SS family [Pseudomonadota bacterium]